MDKAIKRAAEPDVWTLSEWTAATRISRAMFYVISEELRPAHTRIGRRVLVTEAPRAWLERMAARGGIPSSSLTA